MLAHNGNGPSERAELDPVGRSPVGLAYDTCNDTSFEPFSSCNSHPIMDIHKNRAVDRNRIACTYPYRAVTGTVVILKNNINFLDILQRQQNLYKGSISS